MKRPYLIVLLFINVIVNAQTGPGGIGNSSTNRVWLDASSLSLSNGSLVSSWSDKSGNGLVASNYGAYRPTFQTNQINGFPSLSFDGTNDFIKINSVPGIANQPITWFIVGNFNNFAKSQTMLHFSHSGSSYQKNRRYTLYYLNNNKIFSSNLRTNGGGPTALHTLSTSTQILSTIISNTGATSFTNGAQTGGFSVSDFVPSSSNTFVTIGRRANLNDMYLNGNVSEVIVYNYELNTTERTLVENYLASKYNRTISNDHYSMESSGHYYAVTGIGMEGGNSVTDAVGESGVQINTASSLDDGDYLLWGHNNASLTENTTNVPADMLAIRGTRLERTWRIDETGDVGDYTVNIDMTGISLGLDPDAYVLLIDDDGDFSNGGTTIDSLNYSYDSGTEIATWTGVDIPAGSYFTIGWHPITIFSVTTGNWNTASTWNCNCIPEAGNNVIISPGDEVTVDGLSFSNNLTISATASLIFTGNNEIRMAGNLVNSGNLDGTNGIITMNGTFAQGMQIGTVNLDDLNIDNPGGVNLNSGTVLIKGTLTVVNGDFNIGTDLITLNSDATSTARIGQSDGTITGSMIIQRFVDARNDGYSDMSSPVSNATFAQWSDDFEIAFSPYVPNVSVPSAWGYSESNWDYYAIETSGTAITPGVGYEVYLDNDGLEATSFSNTTLDMSGTPNVGDVSVPVTVDNDGWNLIGNPYASFIDWSTFRTNAGISMNTDFMYYDETIEDFNTGTIGDVIAQSQGFWIEATSAGNATFHENNKSTSTSSAYRNASDPMFSLRVSSDAVRFTSNTYFKFGENASPAYESNHDLTFLKVPSPKAPSLYTHSSDGKKLRVNELVAEEEMSVPVTFKPGINGSYKIAPFNIESAIAQGYSEIILEDIKLGVFHNLKESSYDFTSETDDIETRFVIHFKKSAETLISPNENHVTFTNSSEGVYVNFKTDVSTDALISVYNLAGQEIVPTKNVAVSYNRERIDLPVSYQGIYIIRVMMGDKMITQRYYKQ